MGMIINHNKYKLLLRYLPRTPVHAIRFVGDSSADVVAFFHLMPDTNPSEGSSHQAQIVYALPIQFRYCISSGDYYEG